MQPLRAVLDAAARGEFPPADGAFDVLPALDGRADVLLGFTAHFVLAAPVDAVEVEAQLPGDLSFPMSATFLTWIAGRLGSQPGTFDALLCATGTGGGAPSWLREADSLDHPRVARRRDIAPTCTSTRPTTRPVC